MIGQQANVLGMVQLKVLWAAYVRFIFTEFFGNEEVKILKQKNRAELCSSHILGSNIECLWLDTSLGKSEQVIKILLCRHAVQSCNKFERHLVTNVALLMMKTPTNSSVLVFCIVYVCTYVGTYLLFKIKIYVEGSFLQCI